MGSGKGGIGFPESPVSVFDADCGKRGAGYLAGGGAQGEPEALKEKAAALLEEFGLLPWKKNSPYELSQGQQRRLALLSMLAGDRPLLLLDEPT